MVSTDAVHSYLAAHVAAQAELIRFEAMVATGEGLLWLVTNGDAN